jgi:hypothetical protein
MRYTSYAPSDSWKTNQPIPYKLNNQKREGPPHNEERRQWVATITSSTARAHRAKSKWVKYINPQI